MSKEYVTEYGDRWDLISYKLYKDSDRYKGLIKENFPLKLCYMFEKGKSIKIPEEEKK